MSDKPKPNFDPTILTKDQQENLEFIKKRIEQLQQVRQSQYNIDIEQVWADADRDYMPHRLKTKGKKVVATDEDLGWRGNLVTLGSSDWQSDLSQANVYVKIQTALSILVDQNPTGIFMPLNKKYQATTELIKQLYSRSWEVAKSKQQLKLFVYNLGKYGWAIARTYPLRIERKYNVLTKLDQENPDNNEYEEKEVVEYNDIYRENIDPWNAWIDDMTTPNGQFSMRDWAWRKVMSMDDAKEAFGDLKNWKYVKEGGIIDDKLPSPSKTNKKFKDSRLIEVLFYENRIKDMYWVLANGVPVIMEPLPISDGRGNKKLSCWQTYWTLRHAQCPYGIGIYEAMRYDQAFLDRVRNMTIDQLTLSIYKMFFFQGTQSLTETGDIKIAPGIGKQTLDPKNLQFLEVPGPGADAYNGISMFKSDLDEASGISDPLMGNVTGKTAFEIAQSKEAALKRLKEPLDNIIDALETEGYITVSLIDLLYSIPETYEIADKNLIQDYLQEINNDPQLFEKGPGKKFTAKVYPEFPLSVDKDEEGNIIETSKTQFFRLKPGTTKWEGIVNIKPQSILTPSKQIDKALELEMYNMLIPLLAQPPEIVLKVAKNIVKLYDKDYRDILPDSWINPQPQQPQGLQGFIQGNSPQTPPEVPTAAQRFIARPQAVSQQPQTPGGQIVNKVTKGIR